MKDNYYYKNINHNLLRTFYMVAEKESITAASKALFITQPTASLQIQALERDLDCKLFERLGPKIRLTHEGKKFHELVEPIITQLDQLKSAFESSLDSSKQGELNVVSGLTTSLYILPRYLQRFKDEFPEVKVRLHNVPSSTMISMIKNGEADMAVGSLSDIPNGIDYTPFVSYSYSLITSRLHALSSQKKVTIADVAKHKLILPPRHLEVWRMIDSVFNKQQQSYYVGIETGGWEVVKQYVSMNLGISIINDASITEKDDIAVHSLKPYFPVKNYGVIRLKSQIASPYCQKLMNLLTTE